MTFRPDWFDDWFSRVFGDKDVYTPREIATRLRKSPESIYRALRYGELESFRLGKRSYVVPQAALKDWLLKYYILNTDEGF